MFKDNSKIINFIVDWLNDYCVENSVEGFVVGVSGGIDSALTSTLCSMTKKPVLCIQMPIHQSKNEITRSANHIKWLEKNFTNVISVEDNLSSFYDEFVKSKNNSTSSLTYSDEKKQLAFANTRSRLRMVNLYFHATSNNYIVAGTGNKVEDFGVGFYTKYGDGGVDISPIADLMKSEVRSLANFLKINSEIILAKPTDGLWDDTRTDEEQIGANYDELEWAMNEIERGKKYTDFQGRKKEVIEILTRFNTQNTHKMIPIPICKIPERLKN